ncbi:MAG: class I SAM-dependent methyltransferase [Bacteroidetes bacterium HGW-Bacteroidetes-6]|jgi:SAM-dependent methyltransferase|nr:MAG: class I SAM-dependent methyltransferase [Bacteroidetes bacterium HGW-Bacteroidetes-6]
MEEKIKKNIDQQIDANRGKNLLYEGNENPMAFIEETTRMIAEMGNISKSDKEILVSYTTDKALEEFCRVNQYYEFNSNAISLLRKLYSDLFDEMNLKRSNSGEIAANHYKNLREWLQQTNPIAKKIYPPNEAMAETVVSSEYSAELQLSILDIGIETIQTPVLDIGCGPTGNMVSFFTQKGFDTFGIDRFAPEGENYQRTDWLEYNYGVEKWGCIISNLGFSNHFHHHHLREDGKYIEYAQKYMQILASLKPGGRFHYAPRLPFIEQFLDKDIFEILHPESNIYSICGTIILKKA